MVRRLEPYFDGDECYMELVDNGDYVSYEDYAGLESRFAELEKDAARWQVAIDIVPGIDEAVEEAMSREA